jgi:ATP-dependent RNA helicase DeaD
MKSFSFFEVPEDVAPKVVSSFKGMHLEDRKLLVQFAQDSENQKSKKSYGRKKEENLGFGRNKKRGKKQRY